VLVQFQFFAACKDGKLVFCTVDTAGGFDPSDPYNYVMEQYGPGSLELNFYCYVTVVWNFHASCSSYSEPPEID